MSTYIPVITNKGDYDYTDIYVGSERVGYFYARGQGFQGLMDELFADFLRDNLRARGIEFHLEDEDD